MTSAGPLRVSIATQEQSFWRESHRLFVASGNVGAVDACLVYTDSASQHNPVQVPGCHGERAAPLFGDGLAVGTAQYGLVLNWDARRLDVMKSIHARAACGALKSDAHKRDESFPS